MNEPRSQRQANDGTYVARRNGEIVLSAPTYDELLDEVEKSQIDDSSLVIAYIEPADRIRVY